MTATHEGKMMALSSLEREMIWLRMAQHVINEEYKAEGFPVPLHLAFGHEAIAIALSHVMTDEDQVAVSHRNIHYNLARLRSVSPMIEEYRMSAAGVGAGRMGSMNASNPAKGIPYASSILGNNLPVAAGLALAKKLRGDEGVVAVITGDGAMEEGSFYETLTFARTYDLPLMVIVENNEWSLATTIAERRCVIDIKKMVEGLGVVYDCFEQNSLSDWTARLGAIKERSCVGGTPAVIEVRLSTLGSVPHPTEDRVINYHAGPARSINLAQGLIIEESVEDPLFALASGDNRAEYERVAEEELRRILAEVGVKK